MSVQSSLLAVLHRKHDTYLEFLLLLFSSVIKSLYVVQLNHFGINIGILVPILPKFNNSFKKLVNSPSTTSDGKGRTVQRT